MSFCGVFSSPSCSTALTQNGLFRRSHRRLHQHAASDPDLTFFGIPHGSRRLHRRRCCQPHRLRCQPPPRLCWDYAHCPVCRHHGSRALHVSCRLQPWHRETSPSAASGSSAPSLSPLPSLSASSPPVSSRIPNGVTAAETTRSLPGYSENIFRFDVKFIRSCEDSPWDFLVKHSRRFTRGDSPQGCETAR